MDLFQELNKFAEGLEQLRDEVKVQLHLASLESKREWDQAEQQRDHFLVKLNEIAQETKGKPEEMIKKAEMIGEELKSTYQRIKDKLAE